MNLMASTALALREVVRFLRQPSRIAGALASPLLFWLLIGFGLSGSFRLPSSPGDVSFLEYFYPGVVVLVVLFAAIFSTISVIEDRNEGFLQGVLAAPISTLDLVLGKVLGGTVLALLQGAVFLPLAPLAGIVPAWDRLGATLLILTLIALAMTSLGFLFAWRVSSVQGFHAVMNLILMPLWLLSGAFFPVSGGPSWLELVMRANPLTYGVAALRRALYPEGAAVLSALPSLTLSLAVTAGAAALGLVAAVATARSGRVR